MSSAAVMIGALRVKKVLKGFHSFVAVVAVVVEAHLTFIQGGYFMIMIEGGHPAPFAAFNSCILGNP